MKYPYLINNKGFTLIEVLVSIVILAVGLVLVVESMGRTQYALMISRNLITASQLAEESLTASEMNAREFDEVPFGSDRDTLDKLGRKFQITRNVSLFYDETMEDESSINQVEVLIDWEEGAGRESQLVLGSLITNRGGELEI